jgi:hypothetical protein
VPRRPWWQRTLQGAGIAGGIAGAAYGVERAVVAGVRRTPDPDAGRELTPPFDAARRIPSHDGGSLYTISRGKGPTILFSHGVTLDVRFTRDHGARAPAARRWWPRSRRPSVPHRPGRRAPVG